MSKRNSFKHDSRPISFLFPAMNDSLERDNNTFAYLASSKELERYFEVLISLYPITDHRMLHITRNLKENIDLIWRNNGAKYTVTYLKEAMRLFQFFVAGNPQKSSLPTMIGAPKGLPSILPPGHRDLLIERRESHRDYVNVIKIIFALLGCYRLLVFKGELKINTITDPTTFEGFNPWELGFVISTRFSNLFKDHKIKSYDWNLLSLTTSGPNNRISLLSAPLDAIALRSSELLNDLRCLSDFFKVGVYQLLEKELSALETIKGNGEELLGKLSIKEEPAGKRRVFAIVDIWTQSVLKPMHDHVFSILKHIKQDGAFDQIKPVKALIQSTGSGFTACYDLSAATDRFPISLQVDVLSHLYNRNVANSWKRVLVNRPYYLKETKTSYMYGAGQPMGALSSWGVFSLCHHVCVQIAALRVGYTTWFDKYALLGDDIVITCPRVAEAYYAIMVDELKVQINLSKSLQSGEGVMEFAKRIIGPKGDYSSVGPKNLALMLTNKLNLPSLLIDLREKGVGIDYFLVSKLLTLWKRKGLFRFTPIEHHAFLWSLCKPFGFLETYSILPSKWVKVFNNQSKVVGNLNKLVQLIKEEWSLQHSKAMTSTLVVLHSYDNWIDIHGNMIHSSLLPSINEQKSKLFQEFQRLNALGLPDIKLDIVRVYRSSGFMFRHGRMGLIDAEPKSHLELKVTFLEPVTGVELKVKTFDFNKPEYAVSLLLEYLYSELPPVTPLTSPVSELNNRVINRSIRHVSYRFIKKFISWQPSEVI